MVADDHTVMRQGLCKILEEQPDWRVVAQASTGREAVKLVLELAPAVAIFDISMPLLNGIKATRQVCRRLPDLHVLILSMHSEEAYITQALEAGAQGGFPPEGLRGCRAGSAPRVPWPRGSPTSARRLRGSCWTTT